MLAGLFSREDRTHGLTLLTGLSIEHLGDKEAGFQAMITKERPLGKTEFATLGTDAGALREEYLRQGEFLHLENFLPANMLESWLEELEVLKSQIHRNFIPKHKKGGSVGYAGINRFAPQISQFFESSELQMFLQRIVDAPLKPCPENDPHRCALYAYTEEGDHIGFHYDTSYYKDRRWTALIGLKDLSTSRLVCHLHTKTPEREAEKLELRVNPGALVLFNGDAVYHGVTPTRPGEERYIISMQFVTSEEMNPFLRLFSNLKDSFAYFGVKEVFLKGWRWSAH